MNPFLTKDDAYFSEAVRPTSKLKVSWQSVLFTPFPLDTVSRAQRMTRTNV